MQILISGIIFVGMVEACSWNILFVTYNDSGQICESRQVSSHFTIYTSIWHVLSVTTALCVGCSIGCVYLCQCYGHDQKDVWSTADSCGQHGLWRCEVRTAAIIGTIYLLLMLKGGCRRPTLGENAKRVVLLSAVYFVCGESSREQIVHYVV